MIVSRRAFVLGSTSLVLAACDTPCEERIPAQKAFLDGLRALAKPALASNNPLQVEEAAKQSVALAEKVGAFGDWCGILTKIEGNAETVALTVDIGRQVSLYAFNDWAQAFAGSVVDLFSTRSRETPPPGLSEGAIATLKTLRLGERVSLSGRMGELAGSGVFDLSRLFGKSDSEHREFLLAPRFVARLEALAARKKEKGFSCRRSPTISRTRRKSSPSSPPTSSLPRSTSPPPPACACWPRAATPSMPRSRARLPSPSSSRP